MALGANSSFSLSIKLFARKWFFTWKASEAIFMILLAIVNNEFDIGFSQRFETDCAFFGMEYGIAFFVVVVPLMLVDGFAWMLVELEKKFWVSKFCEVNICVCECKYALVWCWCKKTGIIWWKRRAFYKWNSLEFDIWAIRT